MLMLKQFSKISIIIFIIALAANFYILRMAIPHITFLFIACLAIVLIYSVYNFIKAPVKIDRRFNKQLLPFYLICLTFVVGLVFTKHWNTFLIKESLNIAILFSFIFVFYLHIRNIDDFNLFVKSFCRQFLIIVSIVALFGMIKYSLLLSGVKLTFLFDGDLYPWGSSIIRDYNFYSLAGLLSICIIIYLCNIRQSFSYTAILHLLFTLHIVNVFYSGSRRGIIVLFILISVLLVARIWFFMKHNTKWKVLSKNISYFIMYTFLFGFIIYLIVYSPNGKLRETIKKLASYDEICFKQEITKNAFRYITVVNPRKDIKQVYNMLWIDYDLRNHNLNHNNNLSSSIDTTKILDSNFDIVFEEEKRANLENFEKTTYGSRTERWLYALDIFKNQYNFQQKLFGNGFNYLTTFGNRFWVENNEPFKVDYPHNPLLASLLYSGIVGLAIYVLFLLLMVYKYLRNFQQNFIFFVFFLIASFFAFFSGNSHFNIPIFAFFSIMPYYTDYLKKTNIGKIK